MNWDVWDRIEEILIAHNIKPILAVVPDNRDSNLVIQKPRDDFWQRVRDWQARGWFIALHGYQHAYETKDSGLVGINAFSEFAGLPYATQRKKMTHALNIFAQHQVHVDGWVAPGHSFDKVTVQVLLELNINIISDGYFIKPVTYLGAYWIPQQLWKFRQLSFGIWTVCLHSNQFSKSDILNFQKNIEKFSSSISTVSDVMQNYAPNKRNTTDRFFNIFFLIALRLKRYLHKF